jgi:hypothetical protein
MPFPLFLFTAPPAAFSLIVKGGIIGLVAMTLLILAIWVVEMRRGRTW